jgi:hypothetical protein
LKSYVQFPLEEQPQEKLVQGKQAGKHPSGNVQGISAGQAGRGSIRQEMFKESHRKLAAGTDTNCERNDFYAV